MVGDASKVDDELARQALREAETRQFAWSMYIVLEHKRTRSVIPSCSAEDFYAWMDALLELPDRFKKNGD